MQKCKSVATKPMHKLLTTAGGNCEQKRAKFSVRDKFNRIFFGKKLLIIICGAENQLQIENFPKFVCKISGKQDWRRILGLLYCKKGCGIAAEWKVKNLSS